MSTDGKMTPAMQQWCRALVDLGVCRLVKRTVPEAPKWKQYRTEGSLKCAKPTWSMVDKLEAAGLIEWIERKPHERVALLTERGREEAAREVKPTTAPTSGWPFPYSSRGLHLPQGAAR